MITAFSITKHDVDSLERVERLQKMCKRKGLSFSHVVLEALKLYEKEVLDEQ